MTLPSLNPTTSTGNCRSPLLNQQTEPTVALGPWDSMELPTIFSTIPNSVRGSTVFSFSKWRDRSSAATSLIQQCPAYRIDLAGDAPVEMSFDGVDNKISALESRIFLHTDRRIGTANCFTDSLVVVAADPHFNAVVAINAFH